VQHLLEVPFSERSLVEMLIILACLAGIVLGLRFNIAVLIPVIFAGALAYTAASAGQYPGSIAISIVIAVFSLQAGYMIGLTSRNLFAQILEWVNLVPFKRI
jgi:hypothetical protein